MHYKCPLIVVKNIERARNFYKKVLKQKVRSDHGEIIIFEGGFAFHSKKDYEKLTKLDSSEITFKSNSFELYFETDQIEETYNELKNEEAEFLHEPEDQPWGQRVLRFYDPDNHIIEIGETMEAVANRLYANGHTIDDIVNKCSMPKEFVKKAIKES